MKSKQMELRGFTKLSEVSCHHCQSSVDGEQPGQALPLLGCPWGTCGLCPPAGQEPTQAEEGGVWVVWILAFCFGLGRSF